MGELLHRTWRDRDGASLSTNEAETVGGHRAPRVSQAIKHSGRDESGVHSY